MVGESLAIIAVILVMAAMSVRSGKRELALLTLPLTSVSLFHLLGAVMYKALRNSMLPLRMLFSIIDIAGLLAGAVLCVVLSRSIRTRRGRWAYLVFTLFFLAALTVAYLLYLF